MLAAEQVLQHKTAEWNIYFETFWPWHGLMPSFNLSTITSQYLISLIAVHLIPAGVSI
jgi:hypothetical protein